MKPTDSRLSVTQGAALTVGAVLGTGVISLPSLAIAKAGPAGLVAWAGLVVLSVPLAVTFAALGARFPDGGGVSTYVRNAFGDYASAMVGWAFYLTIGIGAPAAAGFAGGYVEDLLGGGRRTSLVTVGAIIALVAVMNWYGIRVSGGVQLAMAAVIGVLLLVTTLVALPHARLANLTPFAPHGWAAVGSAAALLLWAFAGWEVLGSLSAEYRDPGRDIGRATAIALAAVAVLYLGIAFATTAALGMHPGPAPLADLLAFGIGDAARPLTAVVAVLLTIGAINAYFAGGSRLGAALARDGLLPRWLAAGSGPGEIPRRSLALIAGTALGTVAVLAAGGWSTDVMLLLATGTFALIYVLGTAAGVRLLPRGTAVWWWAAVVALVASLALLAMTGVHVVAPLVFALGGAVWTWRRGSRLRRAAAVPAVAAPE